MDFSRIVQRLINRFMRRAVGVGIKKSIDFAARKGKPAAQMTPADRKQAATAQSLAKRARQASRIGRKIGR